MSGGKESKPITVGYDFYMGGQIVICQGPVDKLIRIAIEDKIAWEGDASDETILINQPELFGGDKREGGFVGYIDVEMGYPTQGRNSYLQSLVNKISIPAYRGFCQLVLRRCKVASNNYYLKSLKPTVVRQYVRDRGLQQWQPTLVAPLENQMNGVHIIREVLTSTVFGMARPESCIDETNFLAAAQTAFNEGLGFSFGWKQDSSYDDFIKKVSKLMNCSVYTNRKTGKYEIKMIRNDYVADDLLELNQSNIVEITSFRRSLIGELTSSVTSRFWNRRTRNKDTVEARNQVLESRQRSPVHEDIDLDGVTHKSLAHKLTNHRLRELSTQLYIGELTCNRTAEDLYEGYVFKLNHPDAVEGTTILCRVTEMNLGTLNKNEIKITFVQDIFSTADQLYNDTGDTFWEDPIHLPVPVSNRLVHELPYYALARAKGDSFAQNVSPISSYLVMAGGKPVNDAFTALIFTQAGGDYKQRGNLVFCPIASTSQILGLEWETTITLSGQFNLDKVPLNSFAEFDGEIFKVVAIAGDLSSITVARGVLDTVPRKHISGGVIYFWHFFSGSDFKEWLLFEEVHTKLLTVTPKGTLPLADAPENITVIEGRLHKPYAPGNVKVNGEIYPTAVTNSISLTFAHRNRLAQTAETIVTQDAADIGPEEGTLYCIEILDAVNRILYCDFTPDNTHSVLGYRDPYWNYVAFLLPNYQIPARDDGPDNVAISTLNLIVSSDIVIFNRPTLLFNAVLSRIELGGNFTPGTDSWTIEFFISPINLNGKSVIYSQMVAPGIEIYIKDGQIHLGRAGALIPIVSATPVGGGSYWVAVVCQKLVTTSFYSIYINGTRESQVEIASVDFERSEPGFFGQSFEVPVSGYYLGPARITKAARYTTPSIALPTKPFPANGSLSLGECLLQISSVIGTNYSHQKHEIPLTHSYDLTPTTWDTTPTWDDWASWE